MPCVMANKPELTAIADRFPEVFDKVAALEEKVGRSYWSPNKVPDRFCSKVDEVEREDENGRKYIERVAYPLAADVRTWAKTDRGQVPGQIAMFPAEVPACQSKYALCE